MASEADCWRVRHVSPLLHSLRSLVAAVVGRGGRAAASGRVARQAGALAGAAQPAAAHAVLLVEPNRHRAHAPHVACLAAIARRKPSHERGVGRRNQRVRPPALERPGASNGVGRHGAVAVHARGLLQLVALLRGALEERAVVLVLAHELVRAVAAVLNAVASLLVWDHLAADAQEAVRHARASDVVARGLGADGHGRQGNQQKNALEHLLLALVAEGFYLRNMKKQKKEGR